MKKKNRILSVIIISAMLALSSAGCSSQQTSTKTNDTPEKNTTDGSYSDTKDMTSNSADSIKNNAADADEIPEKAPEMAADSTDRKIEMAATDAVKGDTAPTDPHETFTEPSGEAPSEITSVPEIEPQAGLLTAGEWNDNNNWGFFTNLVNSDRIAFPSFDIDPRFRTAVTVSDKDGKPVMNAAARLIGNDGKIIYEAVTGKDGIAYLFGENESSGSKIEIEYNKVKQEYEIETPNTDTQSVAKSSGREVKVTFDGSSDAYKKTDVMFILDTTGSMGDEMLFLQSEFTAITEAVGTDNTRYSINFYRDEGDEYVTKCNDFTNDIPSLQKLLNNESASGGGDLPEAVDQILSEAINKSSWQEDSVKLAFLIFDAPPHEEKAAQTAQAVMEAAKRGIRIIPVVSSNSDRDTELFGRAAAITTGGTYIFLTDDSGIGGSHLEPIIGEYKVEKLYDIIIRVINDYRQ